MRPRVALNGLGNMGGGMVANFAKAGHDVHTFDLSSEAMERLVDARRLPSASEAAAATGADVVITMLPTGDGRGRRLERRLASGWAEVDDLRLLDHRRHHGWINASAAASAGHIAVDAPVSGGITAASAGTLPSWWADQGKRSKPPDQFSA